MKSVGASEFRYVVREATSCRKMGLVKASVAIDGSKFKAALCVLTYNLTRVLNIVGVPAVLEAIKG